MYLNKEDALNHRNCFIRQCFPHEVVKISLEAINNPIAENIYGDWEPGSFSSVVFLDYGIKGKLYSLEKGEYKIGYVNKKIHNSIIIYLSCDKWEKWNCFYRSTIFL